MSVCLPSCDSKDSLQTGKISNALNEGRLTALLNAYAGERYDLHVAFAQRKTRLSWSV